MCSCFTRIWLDIFKHYCQFFISAICLHFPLVCFIIIIIIFILFFSITLITFFNVNVSVGLTETCAGTFVSLPNELSMLGTVGPPVPNVDVCLESVPEMGYDALSDTPRGEVCVRGKTLFSGYYKREDLTKEVMIDGWFHTGWYIDLFLSLLWLLYH